MIEIVIYETTMNHNILLATRRLIGQTEITLSLSPTPEPTFLGIPNNYIYLLLFIIVFVGWSYLIIIKYGLPKLAKYLGYLVKQFKKGLGE